MISKEPKPPPAGPDRAVGPVDDVGLDRIDLAARLLALKHAHPDPGGLLERAASRLAARASGPRPGEAVIGTISALIEVSGEFGGAASRDRTAALRFIGLLAAGLGEAERSALRGLLRRGELERPLSLPAQRQIRRLCRGEPTPPGPDDASVELEGFAAAAWEALLELLVRSLVCEPETELRIDLALLGLPDETRRAAVRAALERGAQSPSARGALLARDDTTATIGPGGPGPAGPGAEPVGPAGLPGWPPPERALLPAGEKIGRFTLLTRLGVGAMGVVYSAYDPELDRKIAVKLLRAPEGRHSGRAQARLVREAQAMARLNHPNVAVVHDVGTADRDVFVAMEFIRGRTLQEWRAQAARAWPEIVEVYVQAGRGLAAAHAVGLVHRDFKPSNAMIGDDGRVRVLDFGLCHAEANVDPTSITSTSDSNVAVRMTGAEEMVGTPAYMAPEQFHGGSIGAASDQFSFCAALYEALYEQLPFAGDSVFQLAYAVARNELRPAPRGSGVPVWVHAALVRGMKPDPRARFTDMDALLRALDRGRARVRGGALAAGLAVLVAGGLGFWSASSRSAGVDACSGGAAEIAAVWNEARAAEGARAYAAAGPALAADLWPRAVEALDEYAARWQHMHRASCEAHARGEHSSELLDRRMACLGQRRSALAEAVRVLVEADREVALRTLAIVGDLPAIDRCGDLAALEADVAPPADALVRAGVEEQRPRLARVRTLERAGRQAAAVELADDVVLAAERLGDRALLAEALLQRSYLAIHGNVSEPQQDQRLTRAHLKALGGGLDELAAEALALRLYLRGRSEDGGRQALDDLAMAEETLARLTLQGASPGRVRGLVLNNAGTMYMALGDGVLAERMFREALAAREAALGPRHVEVAFTLMNLAMVGADAAERVRLLQRALEIFDDQLGVAHPQTIEVRLAASLHVADPAAARTLLAPGCAALDRFADADHEARARCLAQLAHHAEEAGDPAAVGMWISVDELLRAAGTLRMKGAEAARLRGRAALATRAHSEAITALQEALAAPHGDEWWQQRHRAELALLLGQHLQRFGKPGPARTSLRAAVTRYTATSTGPGDVSQQQRLALARLLLAESLLSQANGGTDRDPDAKPNEMRDEAQGLLAEAESWYRAAGPGYAWRLSQLTEMRRAAAAP